MATGLDKGLWMISIVRWAILRPWELGPSAWKKTEQVARWSAEAKSMFVLSGSSSSVSPNRSYPSATSKSKVSPSLTSRLKTIQRPWPEAASGCANHGRANDDRLKIERASRVPSASRLRMTFSSGVSSKYPGF